jgi:hypothetical protein
MKDMILHEGHDFTWITLFYMNNMIWHEWQDLTRFDMNYMMWHDVARKTYIIDSILVGFGFQTRFCLHYFFFNFFALSDGLFG